MFQNPNMIFLTQSLGSNVDTAPNEMEMSIVNMARKLAQILMEMGA